MWFNGSYVTEATEFKKCPNGCLETFIDRGVWVHFV
jgi:hypothetical protein